MTQHQICPARSLHVSKNSKNKLPLHLCNTRDEPAAVSECLKIVKKIIFAFTQHQICGGKLNVALANVFTKWKITELLF